MQKRSDQRATNQRRMEHAFGIESFQLVALSSSLSLFIIRYRVACFHLLLGIN